MRIASARVTSKGQITIPVAVRRRLGLRPGDRVHFSLEDDRAVLRAVPESWTEFTRGLGADLWRRVGGVEAVTREREAWE